MTKNNTISSILISLAASAAVIGIYHKTCVSPHYVCQKDSAKLEQSIEPVLWNIIRQNPDAFFKVMNEAAQAQQEKVKDDLEKSATQAKDRLLTTGIKMGEQSAESLEFVAFIDMMDPVSREFQKVALRVMKEKKDISFRMIPLAANGLNSEVMARFILAANTQKNGNMAQFLETFADKISQMTRAKLLDTAKSAGFDTALIEKGEGDEKIVAELAANMEIAEKLNIQGTPTVYVIHPNGNVKLVPPMDVSGFIELAQLIRNEKNGKESEAVASTEAKIEDKSAKITDTIKG